MSERPRNENDFGVVDYVLILATTAALLSSFSRQANGKPEGSDIIDDAFRIESFDAPATLDLPTPTASATPSGGAPGLLEDN